MAVIFNGASTGASLDEFTISVPNPADEIRNQGLTQLQNWKAESEYERRRSNEILEALRENQRIESQYRKKAYDSNLADNKRVADNILHNMEVEKKNIKTRSENKIRKQQALFDIIGATVKTGIAADALADKRAKKAAQPLLDTLSISGASHLLSEGGQQGLERLSLKNDQDTGDLKYELGLKTGWTEDEIDAVVGMSNRQRKHLLEGAAALEAKNMPIIIGKERVNNNITLKDGTQTSLAALEYAAEHSNDELTRNQLEQGYIQFEQNLRARYDKSIFEGTLFNKHLKPAYKDYKAKGTVKRQTLHNKKAEGKALERDTISRIIQPFNFHYKEGEGFQNMEKSWTLTLKDWNAIKPKGRPQGEHLDHFVRQVILGAKLGLISEDKRDALLISKHRPKDWPADKKGGVVFRDYWGQHAARIVNETKGTYLNQAVAKEAELQKQKKKNTVAAAAWLAEVETRPPEQRTKEFLYNELARARANNEPIALLRAKASLIKEDYSQFEFNEKTLTEVVARRKGNGTFTREWINAQEVSEVQKQKWREDLKAMGGSAPTAKSHPSLHNALKSELDGITGSLDSKSKYWGQFGPDAHYTITNARGTARADFLRRRQANLNHKDIKDLPYEDRWREASAMAAATFDKEWEDGLAGKGKYAFSKRLTEGKKTMPFFSRQSADRFDSRSKLREVRRELPNNSSYLSLPDTEIIRDKRLEDLILNGGTNPRILWEIKEENKNLFKDERQILEQLVEGYNQRQKLNNTGKPELKLPEITSEAKKMNEVASLLPSFYTGPPDERSYDMYEVLTANGGNWQFNRSSYAEVRA